jgi:hypothetical protein
MNKVAEHLAQALCSLSRDDKTQVIQYILLDPDVKKAVVELLIDRLGNTKKPPNFSTSSTQHTDLRNDIVSNKELGMRVRGSYLSKLRQNGIPIDQINRVWAKTTSDLWVGTPFATERRLNRWFLGLPESEVFAHLHNRGLVVILLCQSRLDTLLDFVLPSNLVNKIAYQLSKSHGQLKFNLKKLGDRYQLVIPGHGTIDVSSYKSEFSVLKIK